MGEIPPDHPRYSMLTRRELVVRAFEEGMVVPQGLAAHGRGEAFDYLLGETTIPPAMEAVHYALSLMKSAKRPVISVNGNFAALCRDEIITLANLWNAPVEINLFHRSEERLKKLSALFEGEVLRVFGTGADERLPEISHDRALVHSEGIHSADVVLVAIEDGDRVQALRKAGKHVVVIDLNPMSRSAVHGTITVVDEVTRTMKNIINGWNRDVKTDWQDFDNLKNLKVVVDYISTRLKELAVY